jgi:hypothetical protein
MELLAEQAYIAHNLEYESGLSKMDQYPPDRFTWISDETCEAEDYYRTGRMAAFGVPNVL